MATALTDAQREAKRERDRAYRARKAAEKVSAPITDEVFIASFLPEQLPAVEELVEEITDLKLAERAKKGQSVKAPRGGIETIVVQKYRDGSRLLTSDGVRVRFDKLCTDVLADGYTGVYYEVVGGPSAGSHGWAHRARGCNRPYQIG